MCGIAGIILRDRKDLNLEEKIVAMANALAHRGPDGEGFITANENKITPHFNAIKKQYQRQDLNYIPLSPLSQKNSESFLAFAHRRLSIIDLSETGHQPMCSKDASVWITFNGEIYNYIELRAELKSLGHTFVSESDTEVILEAYRQWGHNCVEKFNGMWAFCIYDSVKKTCFASRDRFGVKPFYYIHNSHFFAFASEQKAFVKSGLASSKISHKALHNYLVNGLLENDTVNFFEEITELWPGKNLVYSLETNEIILSEYYHLRYQVNLENDHLSENELIEKIAQVFENAVKLRLRSDVEVGTCLSGGIDSSALAVTISELTQKPLHCFTSIFKGQPFNEEHFADSIAEKIHGKHFKTQPSLEGFLQEVDTLVYSQDIPIWSTSTYAQFKVMELAQQHHIKVVLDGQGADELFAGYHHHFTSKWNNLLSHGQIIQAFKEISQSKKTIPSPFLFYVKERLKHSHNFGLTQAARLLKTDFLKSHPAQNPFLSHKNINTQLLSDIYDTRLKSFLKCEDRCGMWHGVESRTPFSDDKDLISLLFSFEGNKKIKQGVSKHLLREALKEKLPPGIYKRYDKKGFETPMQQWVQQMEPQLLESIKSADFDFVIYKNLEKTKAQNTGYTNLLFKLFILSRWKKVFQ